MCTQNKKSADQPPLRSLRKYQVSSSNIICARVQGRCINKFFLKFSKGAIRRNMKPGPSASVYFHVTHPYHSKARPTLLMSCKFISIFFFSLFSLQKETLKIVPSMRRYCLPLGLPTGYLPNCRLAGSTAGDVRAFCALLATGDVDTRPLPVRARPRSAEDIYIGAGRRNRARHA